MKVINIEISTKRNDPDLDLAYGLTPLLPKFGLWPYLPP